jgi:hypothetical protein
MARGKGDESGGSSATVI